MIRVLVYMFNYFIIYKKCLFWFYLLVFLAFLKYKIVISGNIIYVFLVC